MKIAVAADHGGFPLKEELKKHLDGKGIEYEDFGTYSTASVDYPDYALKAAEAVAAGKFDFGMVVCGTGIGISIAANKVPGIRCALCHDTFSSSHDAHAQRRQHACFRRARHRQRTDVRYCGRIFVRFVRGRKACRPRGEDKKDRRKIFEIAGE